MKYDFKKMKIMLKNNFQSFISFGQKNIDDNISPETNQSLCIPIDFNTVLTGLISKPTKNFTVCTGQFENFWIVILDPRALLTPQAC